MSFGTVFLSNPDLFPARQSGEMWGESELTIDLAGGPYRFIGMSAAQRAHLLKKFEDLSMAADDKAAGVEIRIFRAPEGEFLEIERQGEPWEYTMDLAYETDAVHIGAYRFMGRLDWQPELSGAYWSDVEDGPELDGVFENFFRILIAYRLLEAGGALLHSAGIVDGDSVVLFLGPSGAGKSTISRLSHQTGRFVLSDDMNALWRTDGLTSVERLPFAGDFGQRSMPRTSYPLRGLYRLEKGEKPELRSLNAAEALALLVSCSPYVNADRYRSQQLVTNLESLSRDVPVKSLTFSKDPGFWRLLEH